MLRYSLHASNGSQAGVQYVRWKDSRLKTLRECTVCLSNRNPVRTVCLLDRAPPLRERWTMDDGRWTMCVVVDIIIFVTNLSNQQERSLAFIQQYIMAPPKFRQPSPWDQHYKAKSAVLRLIWCNDDWKEIRTAIQKSVLSFFNPAPSSNEN